MATRSITKSVEIKGQEACVNFLRALDDAKKAKPKAPILQERTRDLTADEVRGLFGAKEWNTEL